MNDKELYKQTAADLYKKCDELRDRLIDVEKQLANYQWISVKDRLPEPNTWVLAYIKYKEPVFEMERGIQKTDSIIKVFYDGQRINYGYFGFISHWMPLPNMPEQPYEEWDRIAKERESR